MSHIKDDTVHCEICGEETPMTGIKRCDLCYTLENSFQTLLIRNEKAAIKWLNEVKRRIDRDLLNSLT